MYAEVYYHDDATPITLSFTLAEVWKPFNDFIDGEISTPAIVSGTDAGGDHLQVRSRGRYYCDIHCSFAGSNNVVIHGAPFVNGVEAEAVERHRKLGASGDVGSAGSSGILALEPEDKVTYQFKSETGLSSIDIYTVELVLIGVS